MAEDRWIESIPDPVRSMEGFRQIGYTPQSALADLIDNSISADATKIEITTTSRMDGSVVYIADNGCGMSEETLIQAMKYGSSSTLGKTKLSVYGLGMKLASSAFSRRFTVVSRDEKGTESSATWDIDSQGERPWQMQLTTPKNVYIEVLNSVAGNKSGTVIVWEKADLKEADNIKRKTNNDSSQNRIEVVIKDHLGLTFHRFIEGTAKNSKKIVIKFNGVEVEGWNPVDPDFIAPGWKHDGEEFEHEVNRDGKKDKVPYFARAFILNADEKNENSQGAHERARITLKYQGIYAFREDRLLQPPSWLNVRPTSHNDFNSLRVILDLDPRLDLDIKTDVKKSGIQLPPDMFIEIEDLVNHYLKEARSRSQVLKRKKNLEKTKNTNLHGDSGKIIDKHGSEIPMPPTNRLDRNNVEVSNTYGKNVLRLKESPSISPSIMVEAVDSLDDNMLYEPLFNGTEITIRLNRSHDFYQKFYFNLIDNKIARIGFDAIFWAFARAEINSVDRLKDQFVDMRLFVSSILRRIAEDIKDANIEEDDLTDEDAS